ncbi:MAG TPA: monovalent cation/H+ antiporter complex subunit F [Candidatus Tectomicrobia bacterium]|jgi:multisubunit Na+/H+ antiporter MnhF subunit|nr:monovalent cation/H+ antiporter complex subunit F [Candidatus Tectomicrobia bacterium]
MIEVVTALAVLVLALCIIMAAYRVFAGPSQPDRVIALEVIGTNVVGLILVLGIRSGSHIYVDAALVIALLSFLGTVSLAKYLAGGTVIDRGDR